MKYLCPLLAIVLVGCKPADRSVEVPQRPITGVVIPNVGISSGWSSVVNQTKQDGEAGYAIRNQKTGIIMVWVPGGSFQMGVTQEKAKELWKKYGEGQKPEWLTDNTSPSHAVVMKGFWIGRGEVTIGQYCQMMGRPRGRFFSSNEQDMLKTQPDCDPVTDITWQESKQFCDKTGLRLPTEEEWEYAARGSSSYCFPWGNDFTEDELLYHDVSWCGALDLAGGVREWTSSSLHGCHIVRGWMKGYQDGRYFLSFDRHLLGFDPARVENVGFRVAMSGS